MINKAKEFAIAAHADQKYGDKPYIVHLQAVVNNVQSYGVIAQVVAYLHDVVEDTEVSYEDVKNAFGEFVADCVAIVTDEPGEDRKQRKKMTYEKMAQVSGDLELALTVKAADRLANIQACAKGSNARLMAVYKSEHAVFTEAVYRMGLCDDIWEKIRTIMGDE